MARHLRIFVEINEHHLLPIFWYNKKVKGTALLNEQPSLTIIGFDTDNTLTFLRTKVVIVQKYQPREEDTTLPSPVVDKKGERATLSFQGMSIARQRNIDLREDYTED